MDTQKIRSFYDATNCSGTGDVTRKIKGCVKEEVQFERGLFIAERQILY